MKKRKYEYADASWQALGLMRCSVCGKKVEKGPDGQYRWHETPRAYVVTHRACCADDPTWAEKDADEKTQADQRAALRAAAVDFAAQWNINDLDDLIESLT